MTWLLVGLGAAVGAPLRYLTDLAARRWLGPRLPWGTLLVNVAGCLVLGVLTGAVSQGAVPRSVEPLVGTGLCGALTTYSTFSADTLRLAEAGERLPALVNVVVSVGAGLAAVVGGVALAQHLTG